jgi:NADPH-dependent 2,4-dienoyl-CoA reductase/sulfur reductase-like enzyme
MSGARVVTCEVAVIGAGPAGLAAAVGAWEAGARDIVLVERDSHLGGVLHQCVHTGFGLHELGEDLSGPEYAQRFIDMLRGTSVRVMKESMVVELRPDRSMVAASRAGGMTEIRPAAAVLAMGCRERTRGAIAVPGSRPAGVMTAGQAQRFINVEGILPGRRIVILGSGDIGMIMARRLALEGCQVLAVVEMNDCIGGLSRNLVQCIRDFSIPLYLGHTVVEIRGQRRVEGVDVAPMGSNGRPDRSRAFALDCDTLLLSVGLIPENELSRQAGVSLDRATGGPGVDQQCHTSVPGIFAAGNVVTVFDLVDHVSATGRRAGAAAARHAASGGTAAAGVGVAAGPGVRSLVPQRVSAADGEVRFFLRSRDTLRNATLSLAAPGAEPARQWRFKTVRPPEMISVKVDASELPSAEGFQFQLTGGKA